MPIHYSIAKKTPDRKIDTCCCPNNHTWNELFYKYPPYTPGQYDYASPNGSTCPTCGEQDIKEH